MKEKELKRATKIAFDKTAVSVGVKVRLVPFRLIFPHCGVVNAKTREALAAYYANFADDGVTKVAALTDVHKNLIHTADK